MSARVVPGKWIEVIASRFVENEWCLVVGCPDYESYRRLPNVVEYAPEEAAVRKFGKTGWSSDSCQAYYSETGVCRYAKEARGVKMKKEANVWFETAQKINLAHAEAMKAQEARKKDRFITVRRVEAHWNPEIDVTNAKFDEWDTLAEAKAGGERSGRAYIVAKVVYEKEGV